MLTGAKPQVVECDRYSISETCKLLGICRHTLTKYTEQGKIHPTMHDTCKIFYTGKDILNFWKRII